jgi:hypothetical protein
VKFVIVRKGGEPGEVAINIDRVTHVRSAAGPYTDIWFGDHRVAVEGSFRQIVALLSGEGAPAEPAQDKNWRITR